MKTRIKMLIQQAFKRAGYDLRRIRAASPEIWIDVGAHLGETTLGAATRNPGLLVFAFEPNWDLARQIMGKAANFVVLPMAVSGTDGVATFFVNAEDGSSSLLRINDDLVEKWKGRMDVRVKEEVQVPTIRLDTFLRRMNLSSIDYLKVDAEGTDLKVIQSAGQRLRDIRKIKAEVELGENPSFYGQSTREEMIAFMSGRGFKLTATEDQNDGRQQNLTFTSPLA
jgi:FkbM family methyltransferase